MGRPCLAAALQLATRSRGWPAEQAAQPLRLVAADPKSNSPMRAAEAGPRWDETRAADYPGDGEDLRVVELALLECDGARIVLHLRASRALLEAGLPITRDAVTRGAYQLMVQDADG